MQLMWNRTVNIHGRPGRNVSCNLHLEHMNKEAISGLGSNITDEAVKWIGRSISTIVHVLKQFDKVSGVKQPSGLHSKWSNKKDMALSLD